MAKSTVHKRDHAHQVVLPEDFFPRLDMFIQHPETRTPPIFWQETVSLTPEATLHAVIKHDLYEGVVLSLTLMEPTAFRYLAGSEKTLRDSHDALGDYELSWSGGTVRLSLTS